MSTTPKARVAELRDIITVQYLSTGDPASVKELAAFTKGGWSSTPRSETWLRKVIGEAHGCPEGTSTSEEYRPTYSRNYPGIQHGARPVWVYFPSRAALRKLIVDAGAQPALPSSYDDEGNPTAW